MDRLAYWLCWAVGIGLCVVAAGIVLFMFIKGISALRPSLFVESPSTGALQEKHSGGFLDPLIGTFILTAIGIGIAAPAGVGIAVWLVEYATPAVAGARGGIGDRDDRRDPRASCWRCSGC